MPETSKQSTHQDEMARIAGLVARIRTLERQLAAAVKAQEGYYTENRELKRELAKIKEAG
jgi:hypothetical protein